MIAQATTLEAFRAFRGLLDEMAEWDATQTRALGLDPAVLLATSYAGAPEALLAEFTAPGQAMFLAWVEGEVAGCSGYSGSGAVAEVEKVFVRPKFRGLGLGRSLLERVVDGMTAAGYRLARIETASFMTQALANYRRFGFVERTPFRAPMAGLGNSTVFMERAL